MFVERTGGRANASRATAVAAWQTAWNDPRMPREFAAAAPPPAAAASAIISMLRKRRDGGRHNGADTGTRCTGGL